MVAIKTSRFWRQDSQCCKLRSNFEVTIVQKPHTSNTWISKSFILNYLSTVPHCKYDDAMVLTASVQKFNVALVITTGFGFSPPFFPPLLYFFFCWKTFPTKRKNHKLLQHYSPVLRLIRAFTNVRMALSNKSNWFSQVGFSSQFIASPHCSHFWWKKVASRK